MFHQKSDRILKTLTLPLCTEKHPCLVHVAAFPDLLISVERFIQSERENDQLNIDALFFHFGGQTVPAIQKTAGFQGFTGIGHDPLVKSVQTEAVVPLCPGRPCQFAGVAGELFIRDTPSPVETRNA